MTWIGRTFRVKHPGSSHNEPFLVIGEHESLVLIQDHDGTRTSLPVDILADGLAVGILEEANADSAGLHREPVL